MERLTLLYALMKLQIQRRLSRHCAGEALSAITAPLLDLIGQNSRENMILGLTRDALLPRLLSGQVTVRLTDGANGDL